MKTTQQFNYQAVILGLPLSLLVFSAGQPVCAQTPDAFNPAPDGSVYAVAIQPDGKILAGGSFTTLSGAGRGNLARLDTNGTVDIYFNASANGPVYALVAQSDGKTVVGGQFTRLNGLSRTNIGRFNADGTVDLSFNSGASGSITCLALQADDKILVGGSFNALGRTSCTNIGRLNPDGTVDTTFNASANGNVYSLAVQADEKILVGGTFTVLSGQTCYSIGRVHSNGIFDSDFDAHAAANSIVDCLVVQPDGLILVGGQFSSMGDPDAIAANLARLNTNGTADGIFNFYSCTDGPVYSLALQADGDLVVAGQFTTLGRQACTNIGRLDGASGTLDPTFNPGANGTVEALALQRDGKILVAGQFSTLGQQPRSHFARLNNTESATESLTSDGSSVTWLRGGTGPEVWRTSFDASTNGGAEWFDLGRGTRVGGGWQVAGLALPLSATVRASGFVTGGKGNASGWLVGMTVGAPAILVQPASQYVATGEAVRLTVTAVGSPTLRYQWFKDGEPITGATDPVYLIPSLQISHVASYSVEVSNNLGSVRSAVAVLTVVNPMVAITMGPAPNARLTEPWALFSGTASDTIALAAVEWQLSNANGTTDWQPATGTTYWSVIVTNFAAGSNTFRVRARGPGYASAPVDRSLVLLSPLTITISGCGKVNPGNVGVGFREVGINYTVTAIPCPGYMFTNWTGGIVSSDASLSFVMQTGLVLQANFILAPYLPVKAAYSGLFYETNGVALRSSGCLTLNATSKGTFSAKVQIGRTRRSFSGKFDPLGHAQIGPGGGDLGSLTLDLQMDTESGAQWLAGTVTAGAWTAELRADRAGFDGRTSLAPQAGAYTMVIPGSYTNSVEAGGDSVGTVSVNKAGKIRFGGTLADGTKVAQSAVLSRAGQWPLYVSLYAGMGSLVSWLSFTNAPSEDLSGALIWIKEPVPKAWYYRAGFSLQANVTGSRYQRPAKGSWGLNLPNPVLVLQGSDLGQPMTNNVSLNSSGSMRGSDFSIKFVANSGVFSGRAVNPASQQRVNFSGVVLQKRNSGTGFFLSGSQSGRVLLE